MTKKNHQKVCANCKKTYYAANIRGTYCSTNCRVKANRRKCVTVTEKARIIITKEETEILDIINLIQQKENELLLLSEEIKRKKQEREKRKETEELNKIRKTILLKQKRPLVIQYNELCKGGILAKPVMECFNNPLDKATFGIASVFLESYLNKKPIQELKQKINEIDTQISKLNISLNLKMLCPGVYWDISPDNDNSEEVKYKEVETELSGLKEKQKELELLIEKNKLTKDLPQFEDKDGFVSTKDITYAKFGERIILGGELGEFLGPLERKRCAISLSGAPGSGKTYLSFDLMGRFAGSGYSVGYFSMEEGISDLTREKIELYKLQNEVNCKVREYATLEDIHRFAKMFDVIIIDSWGKLKTNIDEFDKLRNLFPNTFFIVIFQLTSSKEMRGGPKAAYDASVNISTSIENNERIAVSTKNRYNKNAVIYSIEKRALIRVCP